MAHGFSAVKEMGLDRYGEVFAEAGLAVLAYDHRNFGASDGEPRQEINPWAQARDYRHALSWLAAQDGVDPDRIGIWGSSFSGGEVLAVGACDERARAVVANVPFAGLPGVGYDDPDDRAARFERLRDALLDESGQGPADRSDLPIGPVAVVEQEGIELPAFLPQAESSEWFLMLAGLTSWRNEVTVVSLLSDPPWDPGVCVEHISPTPLLMVVTTDDHLAETAISLAAFERAREPKQLELIVGHHFVVYDGPEFARASAAARDFFLRHL